MKTRAPLATKPDAAISPRPVAPPVTRTMWLVKLKREEILRSERDVIIARCWVLLRRSTEL